MEHLIHYLIKFLLNIKTLAHRKYNNWTLRKIKIKIKYILFIMLFPKMNVINLKIIYSTISSVQSLSCLWLFATPWIAARRCSLSITTSRSSLKLTSIKSVMPSSHLILCHVAIMHWSPGWSCTDHVTDHALITWLSCTDNLAGHTLITWLSCTDHLAGHTLITCLVMHRLRD